MFFYLIIIICNSNCLALFFWNRMQSNDFMVSPLPILNVKLAGAPIVFLVLKDEILQHYHFLFLAC